MRPPPILWLSRRLPHCFYGAVAEIRAGPAVPQLPRLASLLASAPYPTHGGITWTGVTTLFAVNSLN